MKNFSSEEIDMLYEPLTNRDLAKRLNRSVASVRQKRTSLGIPAPKQSDPTQQEIAERCAKVREEWDSKTEVQRRVIKNKRFTIPEVLRPVISSGDADHKFAT